MEKDPSFIVNIFLVITIACYMNTGLLRKVAALIFLESLSVYYFYIVYWFGRLPSTGETDYFFINLFKL